MSTIMIYKNKEAEVLTPLTGLLTKISQGYEFWVRTEDLSKKHGIQITLPEVIDTNLESHPVKQKESQRTGRLRARLNQPLPNTVKAEFLEHSRQFYKSRLLWDVESDGMVREFLADNGLSLPNARPVKSDMRSCAGCFTVRVPEDLSILPPLKWIFRGKNNVECNDVRLVIAMAKLGFLINSFTMEGE